MTRSVVLAWQVPVLLVALVLVVGFLGLEIRSTRQ